MTDLHLPPDPYVISGRELKRLRSRNEKLEAALREIYIAIAGGRNLAAKGIARKALEQDK